MEADPQGPLSPYQPVPNTPPPPAPPQAPGSSFGTVTPGAQPHNAQAMGGFGAPQSGGFPPPQKKSRTGLIIGVIAGVIILLAVGMALLGYFLFSNLEEFDGIVGEADLEDTTRFDPFNGDEIRVNGRLSSGGYDAFEIEFEEGSEIVISAIGTDFDLDTVLSVKDSTGSEIAENDDHSDGDLPSSLDSQVSIVASETGTYTIEVSDFGNNGSGAYELIIESGR